MLYAQGGDVRPVICFVYTRVARCRLGGAVTRASSVCVSVCLCQLEDFPVRRVPTHLSKHVICINPFNIKFLACVSKHEGKSHT